jgi:hypothetical protein
LRQYRNLLDSVSNSQNGTWQSGGGGSNAAAVTMTIAMAGPVTQQSSIKQQQPTPF